MPLILSRIFIVGYDRQYCLEQAVLPTYLTTFCSDILVRKLMYVVSLRLLYIATPSIVMYFTRLYKLPQIVDNYWVSQTFLYDVASKS